MHRGCVFVLVFSLTMVLTKVSTHQGLPPSPLCTLLKKYIRPYVLQQNKEYGTLRYISAPLLLIVADRLRGES